MCEVIERFLDVRVINFISDELFLVDCLVLRCLQLSS